MLFIAMLLNRLLLFLLLPVLCMAKPLNLHEASETNIVYGMDHGTALLMDVYKPTKPNGYALLFIMGTGFTAYGEYDDIQLKDLDRTLLEVGVFSDYYGERRQLFGPAIDEGFTVFSINHRLGPKSLWKTQLRDCQRAVQFIRTNATKHSVDPHWIAGMGHSSGATMISLLAVSDDVADLTSIDPVAKHSSRIQAVVAAAGVHDTLGQLEQIPGSQASLMSMTGRSISWQPPGHPVYKDYAAASTISYVDSDDPPFFLIHGSADDAVHVKQSETFAKALEKAGVSNELLILEAANHAELGVSTDPLPLVQAAKWLANQSHKQ